MSNGNSHHGPHDDVALSPLGREHSGKKFVIGSVLVLLALWAILFLTFRNWKTQHLQAAAFGRDEVAAVVDPMASKPPPDVDPQAWRQAVADSHDMLAAVTGSGLLDRPRMEALRAELIARFKDTTPTTALADLRWLWDEMALRAGPVLTRRAERPPFVPPRPAILGKPRKASDANGIDTP